MRVPVGLCRNCEAPLAGAYCSACGQQDLPVDPTLRELAAEAWDAFASVDGKLLASLRLLIARPGALTREYLVGHRASYLPPLRLYLVCSVVYFVVSASLPERRDAPEQITSFSYQGTGGAVHIGAADPARDRARASASGESKQQRALRDSIRESESKDSVRRAALASIGRTAAPASLDSASRAIADSVRLERQVARALGPNPGRLKRTLITRFARNGQRVTRDKKNFNRQIREQTPRLMFVLMPLFAALLALSYRSRRRRYPSHLIVSLHIHAFGFAALTLGALVAALPSSPWRSAGLGAVWLWVLAYVPLAFRAVYGGRLWVAVLRSFALEGVYAFAGTMAFAAGALLLVALY